jgi:carboxymethylenebutenolidase
MSTDSDRQPSAAEQLTSAVPSVPATTLHTDAAGLFAGMVLVPTDEGELPAYRAQPEGPGPFPVVLVVQEIFGLHAHIRDVARRLAHAGYLAIAPELYFRLGDPASANSIDDIRQRFVFPAPDARVLADLDATLAWADAHGGDADAIGVTGFCWGGRITWLWAAHQPRLQAGVAWYGKLTGFSTALQPRQPMDVVGQLKAPVLGLYGGRDEGIPMASVDAFSAALAVSAPASTVHVYPEAPHAFLADYRPSYREAEARDGWARMLGWLASHGVGPVHPGSN